MTSITHDLEAALTLIRTEIDKVDAAILDALAKRGELALEVLDVKMEFNAPIYNQSREEAVISRAVAAYKGPLPPESLRKIFQVIMEEHRNLQITRQLDVVPLDDAA
jgi:chorismate mutase